MMEQCLFYVSKTKQNVRRANHILSPSLSPSLSLSASAAVCRGGGGVCGNWSHQSTRVAIGLD